MKRSEIISLHREAIASDMVSRYRSVLECGGRIQYKLFIWEDGELEVLEGVQGDNSWLQARQCEPRELYYVCTIGSPYFDPWDCTDHSAPDDETEREREEKEIIDWCIDEYENSLDEKLDSIIEDAERDEQEDKEYRRWKSSF